MTGTGAVTLAVAVVGLLSSGFAAWLSTRAQRISAKVEEKAGLFEGYDEFVSHLRATISELETALRRTRDEARKCSEQCRECRESLATARYLVAVLRAELGLPASDDPLELDFPKWGRRAEDADEVLAEEPYRRDDESPEIEET